MEEAIVLVASCFDWTIRFGKEVAYLLEVQDILHVGEILVSRNIAPPKNTTFNRCKQFYIGNIIRLTAIFFQSHKPLNPVQSFSVHVYIAVHRFLM